MTQEHGKEVWGVWHGGIILLEEDIIYDVQAGAVGFALPRRFLGHHCPQCLRLTHLYYEVGGDSHQGLKVRCRWKDCNWTGVMRELIPCEENRGNQWLKSQNNDENH